MRDSGTPDTERGQGAGGTIGRSSAAGVGAASLVSAAVGYAVLLISARTLSPEENAGFLTFWSFVFFVFGVLGGIVIESTRAARSSLESGPHPSGARIGPVAVGLGAAAALILLATSVLWGEPLFGSSALYLVPIVCIAALLYSGHASTVGSLGGSGRWSEYSAVTVAESFLRLAGVGAAVLVGASIGGLAAATALGAAAWLLFLLLSKRTRSSFTVRADVPNRDFVRNILHACLAATASSALLVGFPVMLKFTTTDSVYLASAPLLMALSLTRAPLMIPLMAYQSVAITHFMARKSEGAKAYLPLFLVVLGVAAAGAVAAGLIGPWLMVFLLGPDYHIDGLVLAALTLDSGFLALLTLTGSLAVASNQHRAYSLGWVAAAAVSLAMLFLPVGMELKTILSLAAGPLCGVVVHTWFVQSSLRNRSGLTS